MKVDLKIARMLVCVAGATIGFAAFAARHPELIASESELMRTDAVLSSREDFQIRDPFVLAENGTYYLYKKKGGCSLK